MLTLFTFMKLISFFNVVEDTYFIVKFYLKSLTFYFNIHSRINSNLFCIYERKKRKHISAKMFGPKLCRLGQVDCN